MHLIVQVKTLMNLGHLFILYHKKLMLRTKSKPEFQNN